MHLHAASYSLWLIRFTYIILALATACYPTRSYAQSRAALVIGNSGSDQARSQALKETVTRNRLSDETLIAEGHVLTWRRL